jgi:hypothetical protein
MKAMAVTGFVHAPFPARHLTPGRCADLGGRLKAALGDRLHAFNAGWRLEDCWAYRLLEANPGLLPSCANPPADRFHTPHDMTRSNIVLLQRYWWMRQAAEFYPDVDVFAWIEYTVLKQNGVTEDVLRSFVDDLERQPCNAITLPGCWPKGPVNDAEAHWRFVGSCWICPRQLAAPLFDAVETVASLRARLTGRLSWDMNTMAYVELLEALPVRWYPANHDETQFTHYRRIQ